MQVTIEYMAQVKRAAGTGRETVEFPADATVSQALVQLARSHGEPLEGMLLDGEGEPAKSLLLFLGDEQVRLEDNPSLSDGAHLSISTPISGG